MPGTVTLQVEVVQVSRFGIWIAVDDEEFFLDYANFPWFRDATIATICAVEMPVAGHLYWSTLDIDLDLDSIRNPEAFPLVAR